MRGYMPVIPADLEAEAVELLEPHEFEDILRSCWKHWVKKTSNEIKKSSENLSWALGVWRQINESKPCHLELSLYFLIMKMEIGILFLETHFQL